MNVSKQETVTMAEKGTLYASDYQKQKHTESESRAIDLCVCENSVGFICDDSSTCAMSMIKRTINATQDCECYSNYVTISACP